MDDRKSGFSYNEDGLPVAAGSTDTKLSFDGVTFLEDEPALAGEEDFLNEMNAESELNINAGGDSKSRQSLSMHPMAIRHLMRSWTNGTQHGLMHRNQTELK